MSGDVSIDLRGFSPPTSAHPSPASSVQVSPAASRNASPFSSVQASPLSSRRNSMDEEAGLSGGTLAFKVKVLPKELRSSACKRIGQVFYAIISVLIFPIGIARLIGLGIRHSIANKLVPASTFPATLEKQHYSRVELESMRRLLTLLKEYADKINSDPNAQDAVLKGEELLLNALPLDPASLPLNKIKPAVRELINVMKSLSVQALSNVLDEMREEMILSDKPLVFTESDYNKAASAIPGNAQESVQLAANTFGFLFNKVALTREFGALFKKIILNERNVSPISITTHGAVLDGIYIINNYDSNAKTVVHFLSGDLPYEQALSLGRINLPAFKAEEEENLGRIDLQDDENEFIDDKPNYNLVLVNYRGVGDSTGRVTPNGLKIDGFATVKAVHKDLGVPLDQIISSGHSVIGSAVAIYAAATHQEKGERSECVKCRNDRGAVTLPVAIKHDLQEAHQRSFTKMEAKFAGSSGWNWDCRKWWNEIEGFKWSIYTPDDQTVPEAISLGKWDEPRILKIAGKVPNEYTDLSAVDAHNYVFGPDDTEFEREASIMDL